MNKIFLAFVAGGLLGFYFAKNPDFYKGWGKKKDPDQEAMPMSKEKIVDFLMMRGSYSKIDLMSKTETELIEMARAYPDFKLVTG